MSKLETQNVEDVNISYNPEIGYVIDISYRRTDKNGNVDIISISDIPIYIANYPIIDNQFTFYGCCDTYIDLGFGKLQFHPTKTKHETRRIYTAVKEMTLEEIEKKLGHKIKIVSDKENKEDE